MIFSAGKTNETEPAQSASLLRIVSLLLEGWALHAVQFDSEKHGEFRLAIREIGQRFEQAGNPEDLVMLAGEANRTIQGYGASLEKYIQALTKEKHMAIDLVSKSLLRICASSEQSAHTLRNVQRDLKEASQVPDMRMLREKLASIVDTVCRETERHEQENRELKERVSESTRAAAAANDQVTGLPTQKQAEARITEVSSSGTQTFVIAFFLKNLDVVNRRFGFPAGDSVLQRFAAYLGKNRVGGDQLFRWRGPCFVVVAERFGSIQAVKAEADKLGIRGPEHEVEGQGNSMLFRITAATAVFPILKTQNGSDLTGKIDDFAAEQFKPPGIG
jgi:GGDEF domain-containing protein